MIQLVSAQVIEVIGKGIIEDSNATLTIPNMGTVDKVVVEAAAEFSDDVGELPYKVPINVTFSSGSKVIQAEFQNVDENKSPAIYNTPLPGYYQLWPTGGPVLSLGYYTATFNKADISDGQISLDKNGQGKCILSFYAYIYRTDGTVNKFSLIVEERAFLYLNGIENPMEYEFDLPVVQAERNMKVTIPFSDNYETGTDHRIAVWYLVQGEQVLPSETFNLNALGTNFLAKTLELVNVPGNVTKIKIVIYSPEHDPEDLSKTGDSFILGMPALTVENVDPGCTRTIGYWKTHSKYGPAKPSDPTWNLIGPDKKFFKSGQSYIKVLQAAPKGDKYYILAHQYIAAELNFLAGADNSAVEFEFQQAKSLFETYSPNFCASLSKNECAELEKIFTKLAEKLDKYNNGIIGPGHCDEECDKEQEDKDCDKDHDKDYCKDDDDDRDKDHKDKKSDNKIKVQVSPNPVNRNTTISFTPAFDGNAMVELFDWMGNKKARLYNQKVEKDSPVKFNFNGNQYRNGLYLVIFTNGSLKESVTIKINQ